jgi:hypothetical protein
MKQVLNRLNLAGKILLMCLANKYLGVQNELDSYTIEIRAQDSVCASRLPVGRRDLL